MRTGEKREETTGTRTGERYNNIKNKNKQNDADNYYKKDLK